jgi:hypothetical protein
VFTAHDKASVSPIWFDETGSPVDAWGTRFRVTWDNARAAKWVLCESAGPDRKFGTGDDLSYKAQ